jgi:hypothetical protein
MSFAFILSSVAFDVPLPFRLTDKFTLDKASDSQISAVRERLEGLEILGFAGTPHRNYEVNKVRHPKGHILQESLTKDKWNYWVITFEGGNDDLLELQFAFLLLKCELKVGLIFLGGIFLVYASMVLHFFNSVERSTEETSQVSETDLRFAVEHYKLVLKAKAEDATAYRSLEMFLELYGLPLSNYRVLSCFSVLESLLTHLPNDKEVGDSLTHQLRTKLALLERFFARPLDFSPFGVKNCDESAKQGVWTKLYKYRSRIAHGNTIDFASELQLLKSRDVALQFLQEVAKLVIIVALERPDFIEDLKAV